MPWYRDLSLYKLVLLRTSGVVVSVRSVHQPASVAAHGTPGAPHWPSVNSDVAVAADESPLHVVASVCIRHSASTWDVLLIMQVMQGLKDCAQLDGKLTKPSVSVDTAILYMYGPLEDQYRKNLPKTLRELLPEPLSSTGSCMMTVTDPTMQNPIRVRLVAKEDAQMNDVCVT